MLYRQLWSPYRVSLLFDCSIVWRTALSQAFLKIIMIQLIDFHFVPATDWVSGCQTTELFSSEDAGMASGNSCWPSIARWARAWTFQALTAPIYWLCVGWHSFQSHPAFTLTPCYHHVLTWEIVFQALDSVAVYILMLYLPGSLKFSSIASVSQEHRLRSFFNLSWMKSYLMTQALGFTQAILFSLFSQCGVFFVCNPSFCSSHF